MSLVKIDDKQKALVKKAQATYTPHKRPAIVLDEEEYIGGLGDVIKRDFFPGLNSHDSSGEEHNHETDWANASASTPRRDMTKTRSATPSGGPRSFKQEKDYAPEALQSKVDTSLSLAQFQAKYTSEDNASFLDILDKQNLLRREKHAWHYNNNKIYSDNAERHQRRIEETRRDEQKTIGAVDNRRPADGWRTTPKNALMFLPDVNLEDSENGNRKGQTTISHAATRISQDLVHNSSNHATTTSGHAEEGDFEEPTVNGYGFVDEPDTPLPQTQRNPFPADDRIAKDKPNPFKIPETPARDQLHDRLLIKARRSSTPRAPNTALCRVIATPKFKSSPVLSPAAHRMLVGSKSSSLRDRLKTPLAKSQSR